MPLVEHPVPLLIANRQNWIWLFHIGVHRGNDISQKAANMSDTGSNFISNILYFSMNCQFAISLKLFIIIVPLLLSLFHFILFRNPQNNYRNISCLRLLSKKTKKLLRKNCITNHKSHSSLSKYFQSCSHTYISCRVLRYFIWIQHLTLPNLICKMSTYEKHTI